jgi:hypothetical protein
VHPKLTQAGEGNQKRRESGGGGDRHAHLRERRMPCGRWRACW